MQRPRQSTPTNGTLSNQIYLNRHRDLGQPGYQTSSRHTSSRAPVALWHAADTDALFFTFLDPVCRLSCIVPWWLISGLLNRQVGWCVKVRVGVIQPPRTRCLVWGLGEVSPKRGFPKMPCENVPRQHLKGFILETRNFVIFWMSTIGLKQMDMFGLGRSWFSSCGSTEQGLR